MGPRANGLDLPFPVLGSRKSTHNPIFGNGPPLHNHPEDLHFNTSLVAPNYTYSEFVTIHTRKQTQPCYHGHQLYCVIGLTLILIHGGEADFTAMLCHRHIHTYTTHTWYPLRPHTLGGTIRIHQQNTGAIKQRIRSSHIPPYHRHMVIATNLSSLFDLLHCSTPQTRAECCLELTAVSGYRMFLGPFGSALPLPIVMVRCAMHGSPQISSTKR